MKTNYTLLLLSLFIIFMVAPFQADATTKDKKKSIQSNGEREREYQEAVHALKDQIFLISLYSFVDNAGRVAGIEPEGNFITVNKDNYMMQKSAALVLSTFAGSDHMKGQLTDFQFKENKKGNVQFSFVISDGEKILTFKGRMTKGDNIIEGSLKGKKEEGEIFVNGNVQPVKSHFDY